MKTMELKQFGIRIRKDRERLGISQEELAERSGLHRTYIGGVERGERNIGLMNILRIARALSVAPSSLFQDSSSKKTEKAL